MSNNADKLLLEFYKLEKSFNEKIDSVLHKALPYHFGNAGFRARGTNIYSQWLVENLAKLIEDGEINPKTLDALKVNGKVIHVKPKTKRKKTYNE